MGDLDKAAAAFACARQLDSAGWSLCLDLADVRAEQGDVAAAASLVEHGLEYDPHEVTLRAANAAHRTRLAGATYRNLLIDHACAGPKPPRRLAARARRIRTNGLPVAGPAIRHQTGPNG